jgi:circadian clock protein KaiC
MQRVKTGIDGLDEALNGGIPRGNIILVSGSPGTGKTILCLSFLYSGATKFDEAGVFVSTDQTEDEIRELAGKFGWDLKKLEAKDMLRLFHLDVTRYEDMEYLGSIERLIREVKAKRLVVDSFSTLTEFLVPIESREERLKLFEVLEKIVPVPVSEAAIARRVLIKLVKKLREWGCTCLVTSELPEEGKWLSRDTVSEFLCDGIILLRYFEYATGRPRSLMVRKLRYSKHSTEPWDMGITDKGIVVKPPEKGIVVPRLKV